MISGGKGVSQKFVKENYSRLKFSNAILNTYLPWGLTKIQINSRLNCEELQYFFEGIINPLRLQRTSLIYVILYCPIYQFSFCFVLCVCSCLCYGDPIFQLVVLVFRPPESLVCLQRPEIGPGFSFTIANWWW